MEDDKLTRDVVGEKDAPASAEDDYRTVGEILDDDLLAGVYESPDGVWWFGWNHKDYGPFGSHDEATAAMESAVDEWTP